MSKPKVKIIIIGVTILAIIASFFAYSYYFFDTVPFSSGVAINSVNNPFGENNKEEIVSYSFDMSVNINTNLDVSSYDLDEGDTKYNLDYRFSKDASGKTHTKEVAIYNLFGQKNSVVLEKYTWPTENKLLVYSYDKDEGLWFSEMFDNEEKADKPLDFPLSLLDENNFEKNSLKIQKSSEDNKDYIVSGTFKPSKFKELLSPICQIIGNVIPIEENQDNLTFKVSISFDKEAKIVKSIYFYLDQNNENNDVNNVFEEFDIIINIKDINSATVEIPRDVTDNAIPPGVYFQPLVTASTKNN